MRRRRKVILNSLILISGTFLWFVCVDRSLFKERCDACGYYRIGQQYRLCGVPVYQEWREDESVTGLIARDLGAPCPHPRELYFSVHCYRFWGLLFCKWPCIHVTMTVSSIELDAAYEQEGRPRVKAAATTNPALGEEF